MVCDDTSTTCNIFPRLPPLVLSRARHEPRRAHVPPPHGSETRPDAHRLGGDTRRSREEGMTRGKYATKSANRMANLDNELLQQSRAEVAALKSRVAELETQLTEERRQRGSLIVAHADELSAKIISRIKMECSDEVDRAHASLREVAVILESHLGGTEGQPDHVPPNWYLSDIQPLLIPDANERNRHMENTDRRIGAQLPPRHVRRHGAQRIQRSDKKRAAYDRLVDRLVGDQYDKNQSIERVDSPLRFTDDTG